MQKHLIIAVTCLALVACNKSDKTTLTNSSDFAAKYINTPLDSGLTKGKTYLPVYSQIYMQSDKSIHNLTVSISMRNVSTTRTLYIETAEYYDTKGELIKNYFEKPVLIKPMETIEIVVDENDNAGGTGGNFIFNWSTLPDADKPLFQAVMISTTGQQGLSFSTNGIDIKR